MRTFPRNPFFSAARLAACGLVLGILSCAFAVPAFAGQGSPPPAKPHSSKPKSGNSKPPKPPTKPPPIPVPVVPAPQPVAPPPTPPSASVSALLDISDLGLLRALLPLKLTAEQIVTIRETVAKVQKSGDARRKADDETFRPLLADLAKARADALQDGTDPPADLEMRVTVAGKEIETRLETARKQALADHLTVLRAVLTPAQKAVIETQSETFYGGKRVPPQFKSKPADAPKEIVQDLAMLFYIERVLLHERIDIVLGKMRPAAPPPPDSQ